MRPRRLHENSFTHYVNAWIDRDPSYLDEEPFSGVTIPLNSELNQLLLQHAQPLLLAIEAPGHLQLSIDKIFEACFRTAQQQLIKDMSWLRISKEQNDEITKENYLKQFSDILIYYTNQIIQLAVDEASVQNKQQQIQALIQQRDRLLANYIQNTPTLHQVYMNQLADDKVIFFQARARVLNLFSTLYNEGVSSQLFVNKTLNQAKVRFLSNLQSEFAKPQAHRRPMEYHILYAANGSAVMLYKALQGKRVDRLITSFIKNSKGEESTRRYLLNKLIDGKVGEYHPQLIKPDKRSVEYYLNRAEELARIEVAEMGVFASNQTKAHKIDLLCQLIPILKKYQDNTVDAASSEIREQLFEAIKQAGKLDDFKKALKGKRVKEIILKVTGAESADQLISDLHAYIMNPAVSRLAALAVNDEIVNNTIRSYNDELSNLIRTVSALINEGNMEDAKQLLHEKCSLYDQVGDRFIPKNEIGSSLLNINTLDTQGLMQRSIYATQLSTLYKMATLLDGNIRNRDYGNQTAIYDEVAANFRNSIPSFTAEHDQVFEKSIASMSVLQQTAEAIQNHAAARLSPPRA